ncbi:MAG: putative N-acetyltransferase YvbK [Firmicutes bacterium ADurb.Bin182]|nr:MAG: putative N-acetyltransferase YvbK [Firmicutes bacterium ADurb.Bin182]
MEVKIIKENKKRFLDILLLADEQESMIDRYLERGEMFALYDGDLKSVCVVTREDEETCELKNLATYPKYQGMGYGSLLVKHIFGYYKNKYKIMMVGTGDSPITVPFYMKLGFTFSHRLKNFILDNYDHPVYENGIQLFDAVYLKKEL